jgi:8-oxo-dGTP pyrophosphatase MutT (NUDIX family)
MLGLPETAAASLAVPASWRGFYDMGLLPNCGALRFVFRAITPPGRPRRFDARFFLAEASAIAGDHLEASGEELAHLQWLDLAGARALPLPFITEVVLSEVEALLADPDPARPVPFFHQTPEGPRFRML